MAFHRLCTVSRRCGSSGPPKIKSASEYCMDLVKRRSYEQYLSTLLLPPKIRRVGFAVRAFNTEIAGIRDNVTNKHAAMGRMVFWRELIDNIYAQKKPVPNHPIAREVQAVIMHYKISRDPFEKMMDARQVFVEDDVRPPFFSMEELEAYALKAFSSVYYVLLEALATTENISEIKGHARHAATQLGQTEGILTVIRGLPHNASRLRKVYVPVDLLAECQVSSESIIRNEMDREKMKRLIESMASVADEHLQNARFRAKYLSREEKLIMLPAVATDRFMTRLNRAKCDVYHGQLNTRDPWLAFILYWNKLKSSY